MPPEAVRQWFQTHGEIPNWPVYYNAAPTTANRWHVIKVRLNLLSPRMAQSGRTYTSSKSRLSEVNRTVIDAP